MPKTQNTRSKTASKPAKQKYSAPALERGLRILEAIAGEQAPLGLTAISQLVGKSNNEIVRLLYVLEDMGFIERDKGTGGYQITSRLFTIANARPATKSMLEVAFPLMRELADATKQSCHISVRTDTRIVVIGRVEAHRGMSLSVRVGHNRSIIGSASGTILVAFLEAEEKAKLEQALEQSESAEAVDRLRASASLALKRGHEKRANNILQGIEDYSVPIFRAGQICAALTVPFVPLVDSDITEDDLVQHMKLIAAKISKNVPPNEDY